MINQLCDRCLYCAPLQGEAAVRAVTRQLLKHLVNLCLDRGERQQECVARLLSALELFGVITDDDIALGGLAR